MDPRRAPTPEKVGSQYPPLLQSDETMTAQRVWASIRPMRHCLDPPVFSRFLYRYRNLVERLFNKLKHYRAIATRYEKRAANYVAAVKLAAIRIWLRPMSRCPNLGQLR